ncbi:hypothetical protein JCM3775_000378 [Rhodotorula graminis]|uniref:Impact N-terminal domain-containing protein n=1 Tax=Rhodotorula graminis (strain WP1) TaxID=578459 RepID=A0A194S9Q8_RHOGW|nr:uncharacterized protein RHOBADRAFT_52141 [Rhodotorula graminis WP1]KPV77200.1 hypothetical protein RHOBADRAFT_52141 [Rhodotorula graminis WP1]
MRATTRGALHHLLPRRAVKAHDLPPLPPHAVLHSTTRFTEKKSAFEGHAVRVKSVDEATLALQHILTGKKMSKATHHILAWRFSSASASSSSTSAAGSDCDGEPPAGKNLLELLHKLNVEDVLVVVTRWYGGVPMGPDRFRVINAVGKDALALGGFLSHGRGTGSNTQG